MLPLLGMIGRTAGNACIFCQCFASSRFLVWVNIRMDVRTDVLSEVRADVPMEVFTDVRTDVLMEVPLWKVLSGAPPG